MEHASAREAAKKMNVSKHIMYDAINKGKILLDSKWVYKNPNKSRSKRIVQCGKDGIIIRWYDSVKEAAKHIGGTAKSISAAARGVCDTAYGYIWKYVEEA